MKKNAVNRSKIADLLFNLTDAGTAFRSRWRNIAALVVWIVLSGFTMILSVFSAEGTTHRLIVIAMSLLKYVPMLMVVNSIARMMAAKYLADIYEIENEEMADNFIEHVTFGQGGGPLLVIEDGEIEEKDEHSQLILIGGPGRIQVNLDSAALLEKVDGTPEVIYPKKGFWQLGSFERIREIGDSDTLGEREYAIINLREQRIKNLRVMARTKDGIPVEARDVKIKFSVLKDDNDDFLCEEKAIRALVYQQTTITPEEKIVGGVGFPWNTTIIPLVITEIEKVISSHTADEIAVGIGQKELEINADIEKTAAQARVDVTGKHALPTAAKNAAAVAVASREKINSRFYEDPFKSKAAAMGVHVTWIDIGTWQPIGSIREKIRNTWDMARENLKKHGIVKKMRHNRETLETLSLIDAVINPPYGSLNLANDPKEKQAAAMRNHQEVVEKNISIAGSADRLEAYGSTGKKEIVTATRDMLKSFRKELLAGKALLEEKESDLSEEEKRAEIARIQFVLDHINQYFPISS